MGYNIYPQSDPALYYPRQSDAGVSGECSARPGLRVHCLPACLPEVYSASRRPRIRWLLIHHRLVDLCFSRHSPNLLQNPADEADVLQNYFPQQFPSPITRMMNLRYLIFPGKPPPGPAPTFYHRRLIGYTKQAKFLPRAFVPRHVEVISDPQLRLQLLGQPDFDPQDVAYVESPDPASSISPRKELSTHRSRVAFSHHHRI